MVTNVLSAKSLIICFAPADNVVRGLVEMFENSLVFGKYGRLKSHKGLALFLAASNLADS